MNCLPIVICSSAAQQQRRWQIVDCSRRVASQLYRLVKIPLDIAVDESELYLCVQQYELEPCVVYDTSLMCII